MRLTCYAKDGADQDHDEELRGYQLELIASSLTKEQEEQLEAAFAKE